MELDFNPVHVGVLSHVWLFATLWTVACQTPLSKELIQLPNPHPLTTLLSAHCLPEPCSLMGETEGRWGPEHIPDKFCMPAYQSSSAWILVVFLFLSCPLILGAPRGLGPCLAGLCVHVRGLHVSDGTRERMGRKAGKDKWIARCLCWLAVGCFWKWWDFNANFKRKRGWTHFLDLF